MKYQNKNPFLIVVLSFFLAGFRFSITEITQQILCINRFVEKIYKIKLSLAG